jgi:ketosteroid isomerase-like protein
VAPLSSDPKQVTAAYFARLSARDVVGTLQLFAPDAEITYPGLGTLRGYAELRAFFDKVVTNNPRLQLVERMVIAEGNRVLSEIEVERTDQQGRSARNRSANIFELRGDQIQAQRVYYDTADVERQLQSQAAR